MADIVGISQRLKEKRDCSGSAQISQIISKLNAEHEEHDMVDVIRCCDCKHYAGAVFGRAGYLCNKFDSSVKPEGFCAWAEQRDD